MAAVYHIKRDFRGTTLYPLNLLQDVYPDAYAAQRAKYHGREGLMEYRIPLLDVRWNDVIFCAPLHPYHVYAALLEAGGRPDPALTWFQIPLERLRQKRVAYLTYVATGMNNPADTDVEVFTPATYRELTHLPARTGAYYRAEIGAGRRPLLFHGVPHVLVEGTLDVADLPVLLWSRRPDGAGG
jgi:hypothetical protein